MPFKLADDVMSKQKKWQVVESIVHVIEEFLKAPGAKVTPNAAVPYRGDAERSRQVDVHISIPTKARTLSVGVEVKNEARPLTLVRVEQVAKKLSKLELDRRCIVSTSGYSADARTDSIADGLELLTMEELREVPWLVGPLALNMLRRHLVPVAIGMKWHAPEGSPHIVTSGEVA